MENNLQDIAAVLILFGAFAMAYLCLYLVYNNKKRLN